jgi:CDP-diacylglycerol---glycerol-3-phosphate 3-phosphatidyltransferase
MAGYPSPRRGGGRTTSRGRAHITTGLHEIEIRDPRPRGVGRALLRIAEAIRLTPNALTLFGLLGVCVAAWLIVERYWLAAGFVYVAFSLGDSLDGTLARVQGRVTRFGAFLDSTLDRVAEGIILGALGVTFAQDGHEWAVAACFVALTASFIVSYTRARSEGLGVDDNKGGLMGRPERLVLTGAGIFLASLGWVLEVTVLVLAALSVMTALQRIWHVRQVADVPPAPPTEDRSAPS